MIPNKRIAFLLAVFFSSVSPSFATTTFVLIGPHGITLTADSQTAVHSSGQTAPSSSGGFSKIYVVQKRIGVASSGFARIADEQKTYYDFMTWMSDINHKIATGASVTKVGEIVKEEATATFMSPVNNLLDRGVLTRDEIQRDILIEYLVVGYESGHPIVYKVDLVIDWLRHHLNTPELTRIYPDSVDCEKLGALFTCGTGPVKIDDIVSHTTEIGKWITCRAPNEIAHLTRTDRDITLSETSRMALAIAQAEVHGSNGTVDFPITVFKIPPIGKGTSTVHKRGFSDSCGTRQRKKPKGH